jgi:hypothetical protein
MRIIANDWLGLPFCAWKSCTLLPEPVPPALLSKTNPGALMLLKVDVLR